ncbi:MAG: SPW repeat protein [Thermoguttaceae bacterium]
MRFIPTNIHGMLDYLLGALLIWAPWLFGFADGSAAQWTAVALGTVILVESVCTRYELGLIPLLEMPTHLAMDVVLGIGLAVSPWLFGFAPHVWIPHLVLGLLAVGTGLLTEPYPRSLVAPISWSVRTSAGA